MGQTENVASALYTLSYIKKIAGEKLLYNTGSPAWDGWRGRRLMREAKVKVKVAQSCPTLCDPMDYTAHGILQATEVGVYV